MLLLDLTKYECNVSKFDRHYAGVPQPMVIYHSEEELDSSETNVIKIHNREEFYNFIKDRGYKVGEYPEFISENLFIKTTDKYLPEYTDRYGITFYKVNDDGSFQSIDGCWIRVYYIGVHSYYHFVYSSSGIWMVTSVKWEFSGGPKTQFAVVTDNRKSKKDRSSTYLQRILKRRSAASDEIRAIHTLFNPLSPNFFDVEKALHSILGRKLTKEDINSLLQSTHFRSSLMKELGFIIPELTKQIREKIPPDKLGELLNAIVEKAVEKESSEQAMARVKDIIEIAYNDPVGKAKATAVPIIGNANYVESPVIPAGTKELIIRKEEIGEDYPDNYIMGDYSLPEGSENDVNV